MKIVVTILQSICREGNMMVNRVEGETARRISRC